MVLKDIAEELFPPGVPALLKWRLAMFACAMVMMFHVAWACGWLAYLGLGSGFAYAADVRSLQSDIKSLRLSSIEQNIFDLHMKRCAAPQGSELRRFLTEKIQRLQSDYWAIERQYYGLPDCSYL